MKHKFWLALLLLLLAVVSAAVYLLRAPAPGLPLDDGWIHQVYARGLAQNGILAFNPGEPSSGSTSLGWSLLLAIGVTLGLPPLAWAYVLGAVLSAAGAFMAAQLSFRYFGRAWAAWLVGVLCIFEWHLAWASVSGMEIGLFTLLGLVYLYLLDKKAHPLLLGLAGGALFAVRPEGLLLAGMAALPWYNLPVARRVRYAAWYALGLAVLTLPVLAVNLQAGGTLLPSTLYAKYLVWGAPWELLKTLRYWWDTAGWLLGGPLLLLVPLAGVVVFRSLKGEQARFAPVWLWVGLLVLLYSILLPVIYHHGRYLMPMLPLVIIFGVEGWRWMVERLKRWRILPKVYLAAVVLMLAALWWNGSDTYALQVRLIEEQHGMVAMFLRAGTPVPAVIATHDIGRIGYDSQRKIVDLAGLVTPAILPYFKDPAGMAQYCREHGVTFVVAFEGYYPELLKELKTRRVYLPPGSDELRKMGITPLVVYQVGR